MRNMYNIVAYLFIGGQFYDYHMDDQILLRDKTDLAYDGEEQVNSILAHLKRVLSEHYRCFQPVRNLLLQLAYKLETSNACDTRKVSTIIKQMLRDNIKRSEITSRYIHQSLPDRFKRQYSKREICSQFKLGKITSDNISAHSVTPKWKSCKIQCRMDRQDLEFVLGMLIPVLRNREAHIKFVIGSKPCKSLKIEIGNQVDSSGMCIFAISDKYGKP